MTIESDDLAALRETTSKALLGLLWLHVPIALAIGLMRDSGWLAPTALMAAMAIAATLSWDAISGTIILWLAIGIPVTNRSGEG